MSKIRKFMMGFVFALIVVMGVNAGSSDVKAASTKNFKGNLNATYKNSDTKITIKKVNSKKVKINAVYDGYAKFSFTGKVTSKNTIKFTSVNSKEAYVDVILKWKDKSHFTSKWKEKRSNELKYCADELVFVFDNTKYTQVKTSSTVYYTAFYTKEKSNSESVSKMTLKGNKLIVKGSLAKASSMKNLYNDGKRTLLKKATRTFKLDKKFKAYSCIGETNMKLSKSTLKSYLTNSDYMGIYTLEFIVKNGKLTRLNFCS